LYDTYGECPFGLSCRFGSTHVKLNAETNSYENLVDQDKKILNKKGLIYNILNSDLKTKLWKRKYNFSLSDKIVKIVDGYVHSNRETVAPLKYNQNKGILQKKFISEDQNSNYNNNLPKTEEKNDTQQNQENKNEIKPPNQQNNNNKKIGHVTDEDLIKLRTCEKKNIDWKNKLYLAPLTTVINF
jgi:tRNA-dihydrouridine synthase 3